MGDIAEAMLDGLFCASCSEMLDGSAPGYPRTCADCQKGQQQAKPKRGRQCSICGKSRVKWGDQDLRNHMRDAHGISAGQEAKAA